MPNSQIINLDYKDKTYKVEVHLSEVSGKVKAFARVTDSD